MAGVAIADQAFPTVEGEDYKLTVDVVEGLPSFYVQLGIYIGDDSVLEATGLEVAGAFIIYFTATDTVTWIRFFHSETSDTAAIDNVSVKQIEYLPGQRTVYIEVDPDVQSDGLASQTVLDAARSYITADPDTGITRQPMGLTDETLWVESIYRTGFHVLITNLDIDSDQEAACKAAIAEVTEDYFRSIRPYIDGLDAPATKTDVITNVSLSRVIQDIAEYYGATVDEIKFGRLLDQYLSQYTMNAGETAKTASITYEE